MQTPFIYHGWGACLDCNHDSAGLYKPKMETNTHIQLALFVPICKDCINHLWKTKTEESLNFPMLRYLKTPCGF